MASYSKIQAATTTNMGSTRLHNTGNVYHDLVNEELDKAKAITAKSSLSSLQSAIKSSLLSIGSRWSHNNSATTSPFDSTDSVLSAHEARFLDVSTQVEANAGSLFQSSGPTLCAPTDENDKVLRPILNHKDSIVLAKQRLEAGRVLTRRQRLMAALSAHNPLSRLRHHKPTHQALETIAMDDFVARLKALDKLQSGDETATSSPEPVWTAAYNINRPSTVDACNNEMEHLRDSNDTTRRESRVSSSGESEMSPGFYMRLEALQEEFDTSLAEMEAQGLVDDNLRKALHHVKEFNPFEDAFANALEIDMDRAGPAAPDSPIPTLLKRSLAPIPKLMKRSVVSEKQGFWAKLMGNARAKKDAMAEKRRERLMQKRLEAWVRNQLIIECWDWRI